jgi:hypothetical protein
MTLTRTSCAEKRGCQHGGDNRQLHLAKMLKPVVPRKVR